MGIFYVQKHDLEGNLVEEFVMKNTILDAGLEYLCGGVGNDFNKHPYIAVGTSDITPDTNQNGLIKQVQINAATFTAGTSTMQNPQGNKQFIVSTSFSASQAIGDLTEISYAMSAGSLGVNPIPLNRTLFQVPGQLDTRFSATPELDQLQNTDISNVFKVYGANEYSQTFTPAASASNVSEIAISLASSGNPSCPFTVNLCADSAGSPGTVLGTAIIAQFAEPVQRWRIAHFGNPITVTPGSTYHIVVSASATDLPDSYDLFGSAEDQYPLGQLLLSTNSGSTFAPVSPSEDMGFKTYTSITGAVNHDYVITMVQYDKETAQSADFIVNAFPENNLDSQNTSMGTVRLTVPTYVELPPFAQALKIYKYDGVDYDLLATIGTVRQYFYDNGSVATQEISPPGSVAITTPTGLTASLDTANGGPLNFSQDKYYEVSALLQGPLIRNVTVGPFQDNQSPASGHIYDSAYSTITLPISAQYYETAASSEYHLAAPASGTAKFTEYFTGTQLASSLWNYTNNNSDYFSLVTPLSTNESQLQLNIPTGIPFVINSTRQVRAGQTYYLNVIIPWVTTPQPFTLYDGGGNPYINPIFTDGAANRVPIFTFCNPSNINTFNSDKRLTFEVGYYHNYREESQTVIGNTSTYAQGPQFCLYDNLGNTYFFSTTDIPSSHSDGAYTFKVDILNNRTMQISVLNPSNHTFQIISSTLFEFNFNTQFNGSHVLVNGGAPGPTTQTTEHFIVPSNYSFAIGNPSNDSLSFVPPGTAYVANQDSIYTVPGVSPSVPVPAICMIENGGYSATLTWAQVPGARKYRLYTTITSGDYTAVNGNLLADYDVYYPAYAVQSTATADGNDWFNGLAGCGSTIRNWLQPGVTYGVDSTTTGNTNGYALSGFVGSTSGHYGGPLVPTIANAPGAAEGYLLLLTAAGQKAIFTFTGGGFQIVGETGPDRGIASLYIDGNYSQDIDFYSGDRKEQVSLFSTSSLTPGYHTIWVTPKVVGGNLQANDFSLGTTIPLDYFHITVPALVDTGTVAIGAPLSVGDSHIAAVPPPYIKGAQTYNGNGPTVVLKDPAHTLSVQMVFSLINPNL